LDVDSTLSPSLERKVTAQGTRLSSFREARESLAETLEIDLNVKLIERVTERVGTGRVADRAEAVSAWEALPLVRKETAPPQVTAPQIAVVVPDGGRVQLTERQSETGTHWHEDKAAVLLEMKAALCTTDPSPEPPEEFLNLEWADTLTREIGKRAAAEPPRKAETAPSTAESRVEEFSLLTGMQAEEAEVTGDASPALRLVTGNERRTPPEVVRKTVVATLANSRMFSKVLAATAWACGFFAAARKAFVGDGQNWLWTIFEERFKPFGFVGVLDIIHAMTYVYAAAMAGRPSSEGGPVYVRWITWIWKGEVGRVIEELKERQAEIGHPSERDGETDPKQIVAKALTYLTNQQSRMNYPEYRRLGLPITSAYIESTIKQLNQRVKGSEKFWSEEGGEALLALKGDQISGDECWDRVWQARGEQMTGQRRHRPAA
jgi:hypothetical protein